jgi:hypothetical protein
MGSQVRKDIRFEQLDISQQVKIAPECSAARTGVSGRPAAKIANHPLDESMFTQDEVFIHLHPGFTEISKEPLDYVIVQAASGV